MVGQLTDAEMEDLFGQQPSLTESRDSGTPQGKRPRSQITRSVEKAKDKGKGKGGSHGSSKSEELEIIQQLSRLVLRHEDQLLRIQMDTLLIFNSGATWMGPSQSCRLCTRLPTNGKGGISKIPRMWTNPYARQYSSG